MEPFARSTNAAKKYVVSNTLEQVDWNAELVRGDLGDRQRIDAELAADPARLEAMGDREVIGHCRTRAAALDPASVLARRRIAESERGSPSARHPTRWCG